MYAFSRQNRQFCASFTKKQLFHFLRPLEEYLAFCSSLEIVLWTPMFQSNLLSTLMVNVRVGAIMFEIQTFNLLFLAEN